VADIGSDLGTCSLVVLMSATPYVRPPAPAHRRRKERRWPKRVLVTSIALVVVLILLGVAGYFYSRYRYDQVHKFSVGSLTVQGDSAPMNILLVGDNCRSCLNGQQVNAFGSGSEVGGGRSDVLMVLHLNPATHAASLLSIPRDTWLPVPGTNNEIRVDAALNQGPNALVQTVQQDLGIPINHYVELNFDSFQNIVSALGGLKMNFPDPLYDAYSSLNVPTPGCHTLNGFQALAVVRARHLYYEQDGTWHYDGNGDLSRITRDHEFLRVLATSVSQRGLGNPITDNALISSLAPQLAVDSQLSLGTMVSLVLTFHNVNPNQMPQYTLPVQTDPNDYFYGGTDYGSVVFPVWPQDQQVIDQFLGTSGPQAPPPSGVTVQVLNGSGGTDQATLASQALQAYGYQVVGVGDTQSQGQPSETVVRYAPGQLAAAQGIASHLSGNVALAQADLPSGTDVQLVVGTYLSVTPPPSGGSQQQGASLSSSAALSPPTAAQSNLPPYDPTGCPPGAQATPVPTAAPVPQDLPAG
jgi:LCP family protein required for cell wall assembly